MQPKGPVCLALTILAVRLSLAHGIPTTLAVGPLHVHGGAIFDSTGQSILLRGVELPGLNAVNPTADQKQTVAAMDSSTVFGILRLRWNLNAVRIPVSNFLWRRDGQAYLDHVGKIVRAAAAVGLVIVISDTEHAASGETPAIGLPTANSVAFWKTWAAYFKNDEHVIFGAFDEPSIQSVPGHTAGQRSASDWQFWLGGGTASRGGSVVGMSALVDAIRSTGAAQIISLSAYFDQLDFQGFGPNFFPADPNIIYEVHPFYDHALTDEQRSANFGFLARSAPVYAGRWGLDLTNDLPSCHAVPSDPQDAANLLYQTLAYFDSTNIHWTSTSYSPHSLVQNVVTFDPTTLDQAWTCGVVGNPEPGMGQIQLLWLTGDPLGWSTLSKDLTASAAGGPAGPIAPGEIVDFYGYLFGPANDSTASFDSAGNLPTILNNIRVLFDDEPAPLFAAGPFLITAQAPYSIQGKSQVNVQLFFQDIPSNVAPISVQDAVPGIVATLGTTFAIALNQDGTLNSASSPAPGGTVIVLYATGYGQTLPGGVTGRRTGVPEAAPLLPVTVTVGGNSAPTLYAAEAPGFVGLLQINARIPDAVSTGKSHTAPVVLHLGMFSSFADVTIWVR